MLPLRKGRYIARFAQDSADIEAAQDLRYLAFVGGAEKAGRDADAFDKVCKHVMVEDLQTGVLVCCFRVMALTGAKVTRGYAAQFYDLSALRAFQGPMLELGRFCIRPGHLDPDILRLAWAALTRIIDGEGVALLFGCSSFQGTEVTPYLETFALLAAGHLAPKQWSPRIKARDVFAFTEQLRHHKADPRQGVSGMPSLLRTYLAMGGWVSDHAVVDRKLNTLHVFTGLEIAAIPPARARLLREVAG